MNAYKIELTETLVHTFTVVASSVEEAEEAAKVVRSDKTVVACTDLAVKVVSLGRKI